MVDRVDDLLDTMVEAHCERDKGTNTNQWLIASDWLSRRVSYSRLHRACQTFSGISGRLPLLLSLIHI